MSRHVSRLLAALVAFGLCFAVFGPWVLSRSARAAARSVVPGDLDLNGVADLNDVSPFVLAMLDPAAWEAKYGGGEERMLQAGDFTGDGRITVEDRIGFLALLQPAQPARSVRAAQPSRDVAQARATLLLRSGSVDLDIDSDNNAGSSGFPGGTAYEDSIEDDPNYVGRRVAVNDDDDDSDTTADMDQTGTVTGENDLAPIVIDITPTGATPYTHNRTYSLTYDPNVVQVWTTSTRGGASEQVSSGATYSEIVWVKGDYNGDGVHDFFDTDPFVLMLSNNVSTVLTDPNYLGNYPNIHSRVQAIGDFSLSGQTDFSDIDAFVTDLSDPVVHYLPVYAYAESLSPSPVQALPRIVVDADTDGDLTMDSSDAVRMTAFEAELGAPPAWGAGLPVSPFSVVNVRNGNVLTAISLVGFDPVGPPVAFTLYHNSAGNAYGTDHSAWGFDLGEGWRVAYGGHIDGTYGDDTVTVVADDGSAYIYHWGGTAYEPPAGSYDILTWDANASEWTLRTPEQELAIFDSAGRLTEIQDAAGNAVTIYRDAAHSYRIDYVASAADGLDDGNSGTLTHQLDFVYDDQNGGVLSEIVDPIGRTWEFEYSNGRLWKIHYPWHDDAEDHALDVPQSDVEFTYAANSDRIATITTRDEQIWTYAYSSGRFASVTTPAVVPAPGQQAVQYTESLTFPTRYVDGLWSVTHTDRRQKVWTYGLDEAGNLSAVTNPLQTTNNTCSFTYDEAHNVLTSTDELGHTWTLTYGAIGNLATVQSPLTGQTWTLQWDGPAQGEPANLYRLRRILDPFCNASDPNYAPYVAEYDYDDANLPTAVTTYREPASETGGAASETTIEYYGTDPNYAYARGKLHRVTDAKGVQHEFTYNLWGYYQQLREGYLTTGRTSVYPVGDTSMWTDALGRPTEASQAGCANLKWDVNSNLRDEDCCGSDVVYLCQCLHTGRSRSTGLQLGGVPRVFVWSKPTGGAAPTEYDIVGRPTAVEYYFDDGGGLTLETSYRHVETEYDAFGRVTGVELQTDGVDYSHLLTRSWESTYDPDGRALTVTGPDSARGTATFTYDDAGRLTAMSSGGMGAAYVYDDAHRLTWTRYTDGAAAPDRASIERHYDDAGRLQWIKNYDASSNLIIQITYAWNLDNTLASRTEYVAATSQTTVFNYEYDLRKRLAYEDEIVQGNAAYSYSYEYDAVGNRTRKDDNLNDLITIYYYDTDCDPTDPSTYPDPNYVTFNNRVLRYELYAPDGQSGYEVVREVFYTYLDTGNVAHISILDHLDGEDSKDWPVKNLELVYATNNQLWLAIWSEWIHDNGDWPENDAVDTATDVWEFRYDSGVQRYAAVHWDPVGDSVDPDDWVVSEQLWTDYCGDTPYIDYTAAESGGIITATEQTRYLPGVQAWQDMTTQGDPATYSHQDLIGSTMLTTDEDGDAVARVSYTAFGETVGNGAALGTRYRYAGGYGYESGTITLYGANPNLPPITLQHVGARWYQPDLGRFVQRDPIGLMGGLNVYVYCENMPLGRIDPSGLESILPPFLPGHDTLPHNPNGWIDIPPTQRPQFGPDRKWRAVPRDPIPAKLSRWARFKNWLKPSFPMTLRAAGAICVAAAVGYIGGTALDRWHPGTDDRYSEILGRAIYRAWPWRRQGITFRPGGGMSIP